MDADTDAKKMAERYQPLPVINVDEDEQDANWLRILAKRKPRKTEKKPPQP